MADGFHVLAQPVSYSQRSAALSAAQLARLRAALVAYYQRQQAARAAAAKLAAQKAA